MRANRKRWRVGAEVLDPEDDLGIAALHAWEKVWTDHPTNRYWLRASAVLRGDEHAVRWGHLLRFEPERVHDSWRT